MEGSTSKETHFQYAHHTLPTYTLLYTIYWSMLTIQCHHYIRVLRVQDAASPPPNGLRATERRDESGGGYPRPAIEDKDTSRRAARKGAGVKNKIPISTLDNCITFATSALHALNTVVEVLNRFSANKRQESKQSSMYIPHRTGANHQRLAFAAS